jgi:DNA-binding transcriptional LysR family regulator
MVVSADGDLAIGPDQGVSEDVAWTDLRHQPLVAAGRDYERNVSLMRAGADEHERIAPMDIVDNISTALGKAAEGLAVTLAPAYVGLLARPLGLVMRNIVEPELVRQVCLYHSTTRTVSPAAEGFRDHLIAWLRGKGDLGMAAGKAS